MFSFKMSRIYRELSIVEEISAERINYITEQMSKIYDSAQYVLRNPTDNKRVEEMRPVLESHSDKMVTLSYLIPKHLIAEWDKYAFQLRDLTDLALISVREWKNIQDDLNSRMVYNFILGSRVKSLFIMASITFLRYMDIQFSCLDGYPMTTFHNRKIFQELMTRIGSGPLQCYGEIYENYFYHEYLMTNRRLADLLPHA